MAAVVLAALSSVCFEGGDEPTDAAAYVMCQQFVEDRLRAPSTAGFANMSEALVTGGPTTWTVRAHVDSQNGFGAMVRTPFTCSITYVGDDRWRLMKLELDE